MSKDLIGNEMTAQEIELLDLYRKLKTLGESQDLAPCISSNLQHATASLWQIVNDLGLDWEQPYDSGI